LLLFFFPSLSYLFYLRHQRYKMLSNPAKKQINLYNIMSTCLKDDSQVPCSSHAVLLRL
jgi:hypothetical protein